MQRTLTGRKMTIRLNQFKLILRATFIPLTDVHKDLNRSSSLRKVSSEGEIFRLQTLKCPATYFTDLWDLYTTWIICNPPPDPWAVWKKKTKSMWKPPHRIESESSLIGTCHFLFLSHLFAFFLLISLYRTVDASIHFTKTHFYVSRSN